MATDPHVAEGGDARADHRADQVRDEVPALGFPRPPHLSSRWWLDRSVRVKGLTVLAIPMLAFIAVTIAGVGLQMREQSQREVAIAANALIKASTQVLADAVNAETSIRGYAGTGDSVFLKPYNDAAIRVGVDVSTLRAAATTDGQRAGTAAIAATLAQELRDLATLRASVSPDIAPVQNVSAALVSQKAVMDTLRAQLVSLASEPAKLAGRRSAAITRLEHVIEVVELVGLGVGLLAGSAGVALYTSGISRRLHVAADNAERLGQGRPLLPTAPSKDELGQLKRSLVAAGALLSTRLHEVYSARDDAVRATRAKNTFLSRTSHELRTPLNAILGFAQLLEMSDLGHDDRDSAQRILGAGRHLLALINELIDTARVETGELRLSMECVLLDHVTDEVASLIGPQAVVRRITVVQERPDGALAAYADEQRLRQVLVNLASNAVKYNRQGGTITITALLSGEDQVSVSIADTGPGLTELEIERIFVPFERLEAEQHGIEGTGIGLPLALALTEAMQGVLDVDSAPGQGSTFTVRLPRADAASLDGAADALRAVVASHDNQTDMRQSVRVLSIEDNAANALLLNRLFREWPGTTLYSASTAQAGIELALTHQPDVILLDLHLPDLPGEEVFARLQAEAATMDIPVVVLSADASPRTVRRLLARGVSGYLTKPVDLRELHELIHEMVAMHHARMLGRAEHRAGDGVDGRSRG